MTTLSKEIQDKLQGILEQREKELLAEVRRESGEKDSFRDVASELSDPGDQAFADLTTDLDNAQIGRDVLELRAIVRARQRMDDGSYGSCVDCGEEIPVERLMAQPTAERCARDQEQFEKTHSGSGRGATL